MTIELLATVSLCITGWSWTARAGMKIANWRQTGSSFAKRVAIGNALASLLPFVLIVVINWPNPN